jgi:hypothetical protein
MKTNGTIVAQPPKDISVPFKEAIFANYNNGSPW